ncbi:hypothetical protein [Umezawaea sp. Da 62-37]|uniref:hypothetical protein n=1 Tax=Umezawaea sp. Da 62-37 TaxID=3075927 RepID=UPI0028F74E54|nr:hypothetical protein [Umezawaea sp. Da 62-37]WNV85232.1 hypothetical protein RM788_45085 [Umezawaea sp. Da 62-37]
MDGEGELDRAEFAALMAGSGHTCESASVAFDLLAPDGTTIRGAYFEAWKAYAISDGDCAANAMMI